MCSAQIWVWYASTIDVIVIVFIKPLTSIALIINGSDNVLTST